MVKLNNTVQRVTERIARRSKDMRAAYIAQMQAAASEGPQRSHVSCGNLAHAAAACGIDEKKRLAAGEAPNIAIVTSYNDMLSAHQPLGAYPDIIKKALAEQDATAQIAGGVPAMCDGVTQGQAGMDLSLFSRDVIALSTAVSLSHNVFDGAIMLGVCDKIVPGLFMGAARFGQMPILFLPAGPMHSGLPNDEKAKVRQLYAEGKIGRDDLLEAESKSYHSPGTCTFYGTANSNQMMMEVMGLHLPGSAFVNPGTPLRHALVKATARQAAAITALGDNYQPFYKVIDERSIVNAIIGLHATGGSTNHLIHLVAMARACGIAIDWDDFSDLSEVTPLLTRIYPNGSADVNHFSAAGGIGFVIRELIDAGFLHGDAETVMGQGLKQYSQEPYLEEGDLRWRPAVEASGNTDILRTADDPFDDKGGLRLLKGNLGRSVIKTSAVKPEHHIVEAPAIVFQSQAGFMERFKSGELNKDFVAVVPFQGPRANGMPELHRLTPALSVLQNRGFKVALITDGRMSGASGKVPAAIHMTPEAAAGGAIAKLKDGDMIKLDATSGVLSVDADLENRTAGVREANGDGAGTGRELFAGLRSLVSGAEQGAMTVQLQEIGVQ